VEQKASAGPKNTFLGVPSVGKLVEFKRAALRRGLWFRVLDRAERGVIARAKRKTYPKFFIGKHVYVCLLLEGVKT